MSTRYTQPYVTARLAVGFLPDDGRVFDLQAFVARFRDAAARSATSRVKIICGSVTATLYSTQTGGRTTYYHLANVSLNQSAGGSCDDVGLKMAMGEAIAETGGVHRTQSSEYGGQTFESDIRVGAVFSNAAQASIVESTDYDATLSAPPAAQIDGNWRNVGTATAGDFDCATPGAAHPGPTWHTAPPMTPAPTQGGSPPEDFWVARQAELGRQQERSQRIVRSVAVGAVIVALGGAAAWAYRRRSRSDGTVG